MAPFKCGALPAMRPGALRDLEVYAEGTLPNPPASVEVAGAGRAGIYPMDGNDAYGDCTIAGAAHSVEAWNLELGESDPVPSGPEVVSTYLGLTGGADNGLAEAEVLKQWRTVGLFGQTIRAYAPVPTQALLNWHQAIAFYGGIYLGIECPLSAQEQALRGEPWTYVPGSPIEGGHCIVGLGYDVDGDILIASWGGLHKMTAAFRARFVTEAWCVLPHQLVEAKKDALGIDLAPLEADLDRV